MDKFGRKFDFRVIVGLQAIEQPIQRLIQAPDCQAHVMYAFGFTANFFSAHWVAPGITFNPTVPYVTLRIVRQ